MTNRYVTGISFSRPFRKIKAGTNLVTALLCGAASHSAHASAAYDHYITGDIKDITSVRGALMVRMDDDKVPSICGASGTSWMRIDQSETAMVSVVLAYWLQGKRRFTLYTDGWTSGYCPIGQADPEN